VPSTALTDFQRRLLEVNSLLAADPTRTGKIPLNPELTGAINRASVVLICSHIQGYVEDLIAELADAIAAGAPVIQPIPVGLIDVHITSLLADIVASTGQRREGAIRRLVDEVAPRWSAGTAITPGLLDTQMIISDFGNPWPTQIRRVFRRFGITDIFRTIAPQRHHVLTQVLDEIVGKRNEIAHGRLSVSSTRADVQRYKRTAATVCERIDRHTARHVKAICRTQSLPW